jgi:fucose permease
VRKNVATTLGFLIAPLFAAIAFPTIRSVALNDFDLNEILGAALVLYFYALGVTLIVGLPVYLRKR